MPSNSFNVGKDVTLQVVTPQGPLNLPVTTTGFESKPQYSKLRSKGLDGINRGANIPDGWEGSITLDRSNSVVDDFFAAQEAGYYAGQNVLNATITETIQEISGAISQYRYTGVCLSFDEAGSKKGDQLIAQTIGFYASQRIKVA